MSALDERAGWIRSREHCLWLGLILLVGLGMRVWGSGFGLPNVHCRPDETTLVHKALAIGAGDLNPRFFNYPSFHFYLLALLYGVYFGGGWASGRFAGLESFEHLFFTDPSSFYLIGRLCSAGFGTGSIWLTYLLARRIGGRRAGWLSAFFLSLAFLHVRDSHFLTADVPATFYMLLAYVFLLRYLAGAARTELIWSSVWFGLAASTKYNLGLFGAAALVIAALARQGKGWSWQRLLGGAGVMGLAFVAGSPFALLDFGTCWRDLSYERIHFIAGHGLDLGRGWLYHLGFTLPHALGWPLFLVSLAGCGWLGWRRTPAGLALLSGLLVYYGVAGSGRAVFMRYMLPVVPLLCIAAGSLVEALARRWGGERRGGWLTLLLAVLMISPSARAAWEHNRLLTRPDTRLLAARWIEDHLPDGTRIAMHGSDFGYPQVRRSRRWLQEQLEDVRARGPGGKRLVRMLQLKDDFPRPSYYVVELQAANPLNRRTVWTTFSTARLVQEDVRWIVTHEHPLAYSQVDPAFAEQLAQDARLIQRFDPFKEGAEALVYDPIDAYYVPVAGFARVGRPGPLIRIYQLPD